MKNVTLWFIIDNWKILLAMKKRWFGKWFYNWFWWKQENWETIEQSMIREANEEIWIKIKQMKKVGILNFYFEDKASLDQKAYVFKIISYEWIPKESDEMKPFWFNINKIPFDKMWEDDIIWFNDFLNWNYFEYNFYFDENWKLLKWEKIWSN